MKRTASALALVIAVFALTPLPAMALLNRVNVSAARGNDADPNCGPAANPCRSLQTAHNQVASGGEIDILDPGGYGALIITKSVSIINDGVGVSGSLNVSGDAIVINAGANGVVTIKGLTLNGGGSAARGIVVQSAKSVVLTGLHIENFARGLRVEPTTDVTVSVRDTLVTRSFAGDAIVFQNTAGVVIRGTVLNSVSTHNFGRGLVADNQTIGVGSTMIEIEDSYFDHQFRSGGVDSTRGAVVVARRVGASHNFNGFTVSLGGRLSLDACVAFDNSNKDVFNTLAPGTLTSFQNNQYDIGEGTITAGTLH